MFSREEILQEIFSCDVPKFLYWELCDKLLKKELVTNICFDESIDNMEDMLFFWQVMIRAKSFAYAPMFKYHYRMRAGSAVHSRISSKTISSGIAMQLVWQAAQKENEKLKQIIFCQYIRVIVRTTRKMLVYDAECYARDIKNNQTIIRNYLIEFLSSSHLSLTTAFPLIRALIFLCLPFSICCCLLEFIKKR